MKNKRLGLILLILSIYNVSWAQRESQFTQYMYNTTSINPAYAGSREVMSIFGMHRNQWVGLDGAPVTNVVSINAPIEFSNVGWGTSIINDKIGPMTENSISADFSYTINTSDTYKLSFGLKATANLLNVDFTKLNIYDPSDPRFQENIDNKFSPNIGAGVYWYSDVSYIGLSLPKMLETSYYDKSANNTASSFVVKERMSYYLMAGYVFDIDRDIKFKPSMLTKVVRGAPLQMDLSANFIFDEIFTAGIAYRWSAAVSGMVAFQVSDGMLIGYAYDAETTKLANYNSGSHEIFFRYEFSKKRKITRYRCF
ncbi:type IX secretion system membrane protein PorP/SprF [Flavobacterium sp. LS1R47]|uniref:Type IX secretion system membrane protein PorP/SprF n=1 Tax=Flavobacterium frigoritolerans TaxID=2987686 RepID=A0A9X3HMZ6_9FLAO|nr:type IX secretion system membrane protein PorP/SprF [Flavobacterium frigoritolerans]MCV9934325.1 type IX secretion system membrane protein PorP/SprF [Flavobacterium frigoritolerans]